MGKTNLGRVAFAPRGTYNNETSYKRLDVVEYEGSSYLFLKDSTGITPTGDSEVTMLLAKKGKDFAYEDFTPEQLAALKGADGKDGVNGVDGKKGDKGDPGKGLTILGYYGTLDLLKAGVTTPEPGDAYGIGTAAPYDIYVFDGVTNDWVNNGKLSGGGEGGGNVVLIPFAVLSLTNASTSEEILNVFGGKEAFIDVVTRVKDGATVTIKQGSSNGGGVLIYTLVNFNAYIAPEQGMYQLGFTFINSLPDGKENAAYVFLLQNEVIQLVAKEVTPLGYANIVSIPFGVMSLSNESTSDEIKTAFGGKPAFDAIIEKVRAGKAVAIIPDAEGSVFSASGIGVDSYTDSNNLNLSIISTSYGALFRVSITVVNGVFSCYASGSLLLTDSDLVSDPSVGGTDKPASAEAVKALLLRIEALERKP